MPLLGRAAEASRRATLVLSPRTTHLSRRVTRKEQDLLRHMDPLVLRLLCKEILPRVRRFSDV